LENVLNLNQTPQHNQDDHHDSSLTNGIIPAGTPILNTQGEPIWKVLVFDGLGQDIISSVLRVNDLRTWGVTIHLCVHKTYNLLRRGIVLLMLMC